MQSIGIEKPAKIITVTVNSAIDFIIEVNNFSAGCNLLADKHVEFAAGKGINVAKTIGSLRFPVTVLGFVGQQSLSKFDAVKSAFISTDYSPVFGKTRTNITVLDSHHHTETHIRTVGYSVTAVDCQSLQNQLARLVDQDDIVILSGSLPMGATNDLYRHFIELCHKKSAFVFLDGSGESLRQGIAAKPFLVKSNLHELEQYAGQKFSNDEQIIDMAKTIVEQGVEIVAVSRGEKGVLVVDKSHCYQAFVDQELGMPTTTIGCGDAMLGGFAVAKARGYAKPELIKLGVSCATANLFSLEPGNIDQDKVAAFFQHISVSLI
jgi:1-phosphofructokinase family hexose kinase